MNYELQMPPLAYIPAIGQFKMPPLSGATRFGGLLFVSGTPGYYPDGSIDEGQFDAQFDRAMAAMTQLLESGGSSLRSILKVNILLTRLKDVPAMNKLYARAFGHGPYPARTTAVVASLPDPRMLLEIECVAAVGDNA